MQCVSSFERGWLSPGRRLAAPADVLDLNQAGSAPCLLERLKAGGRVREVPRLPWPVPHSLWHRPRSCLYVLGSELAAPREAYAAGYWLFLAALAVGPGRVALSGYECAAPRQLCGSAQRAAPVQALAVAK